MGGFNETTIAQKAETPTGEIVKIGDVRIHQSDTRIDEYDFHDDKNGLKVSMKVYDWDAIRLAIPFAGTVVIPDKDKGAALELRTRLRPKKPKKGEKQQVDVLARIRPISGTTDDFEKLRAFALKPPVAIK